MPRILANRVRYFRPSVICADNQEVHLYIQESEIKHVTKCMKDKKGVSEEMLRYAFDNDYVTHTSKNNKFRYHIFLNYTFTGTPNDVEEFIKGKESDGNASRIAWASIPESQVTDKAQELPDGANLELILGNINLWREQYCFETDKSGKDTAVKEVTVDLSYINAALKEWLKKQEKFSRWPEALIIMQSIIYGFGEPISKIAFEVTPVYTMMSVRYLIAFIICAVIFRRKIIWSPRFFTAML